MLIHYNLVELFQMSVDECWLNDNSVCCIGMAAIVRLIPISSTMPDFIALMIKATIGGVVYMALSMAINAANSRTFLKKLISDRRLKAVTA